MKGNFNNCLETVLAYEGGLVDNPADPGGLTNQGVTQAVYDAWRAARGLSPRSVRALTPDEKVGIYSSQYWEKVGGDDLPTGIDLAVFDYGVNSGAGKAVKDLQRVLGVPVDGVMGALTIQAALKTEATVVVGKLCDTRLSFMRTLKGWRTFGNGWTSRVNGIRAKSLTMVVTSPTPVIPPDPAPTKAVVADQKKLKTPEGIGLSATAIGAGGQTLLGYGQQVAPHIGDTILGKIALVGFTIIIAIGGLLVGYSYFQRIKEAGGFGGFIASLVGSGNGASPG